MEEYLAYSEISKDSLVPLVAVVNSSNGTVTYRDLVKNDILFLLDHDHSENDDEHPMKADPMGGWLFKSSGQNKSSWVRRYVMLKAGFLFFFHTPQNEKPIGIVPLMNCEVHIPQDNAKTFEAPKLAIRADAAGGYEFELLSSSRDPVRMHCTSDEERENWADHINERLEALKSIRNGGILTLPKPKTKLASTTAAATKIVVSTSRVLTNSSDQQSILKSSVDENEDNISVYTSKTMSTHETKAKNIRASVVLRNAQEEKEMAIAVAKEALAAKEAEKLRLAELERKAYELEKAQQKIAEMNVKRELLLKARVKHQKVLDEAIRREVADPLRLADMYRFMLFFTNEQVVDDPPENIDNVYKVPSPKGIWSNKMLSAVYRHYCSEGGFMTYADYAEFFEDSGIATTHVPRDEYNEPLKSFMDLLDPVTIVDSAPRELGFSKEVFAKLAVVEGDDDVSEMSDLEYANELRDESPLNFSQFYYILNSISKIVYADLAEQDGTLALNKLLLESILPLYVWITDHCKKGCTDPLLLEPRIPIVFTTYAPNLWKVFLLYAQDLAGRPPSLGLPFPEAAKCSEKVLFGLPYGVNIKKGDVDHATSFKLTDGGGVSNFTVDTAFIMTKTSALKFAKDYAIVPFLMTKKQLLDAFNQTNRVKSLAKSTTVAVSNAASSVKTSALSTREPFKPPIDKKAIQAKAMYFGGKDSGRGMYVPPTTPPTKTDKLIVGDFSPAGGIGFSEFIELLGRIAVEGLKQDQYHSLFPSPFGKVLALLTVWCIADLNRMEDVRAINTEEL